MIKLIGIIFIVGSGAGLGAGASQKLRIRTEYCCAVRAFFTELWVLLRFCGDTLMVLLTELSQRESLSGLVFLRETVRLMNEGGSFPDAWKTAVQSDRNTDESLRGLLLSFGESLGASDLCGQQKNIERAEAELREIHEKALSEYSRKGRLYRSLGLLGGITAALLFC